MNGIYRLGFRVVVGGIGWFLDWVSVMGFKMRNRGIGILIEF
jgi:hypothetical protein